MLTQQTSVLTMNTSNPVYLLKARFLPPQNRSNISRGYDHLGSQQHVWFGGLTPKVLKLWIARSQPQTSVSDPHVAQHDPTWFQGFSPLKRNLRTSRPSIMMVSRVSQPQTTLQTWWFPTSKSNISCWFHGLLTPNSLKPLS